MSWLTRSAAALVAVLSLSGLSETAHARVRPVTITPMSAPGQVSPGARFTLRIVVRNHGKRPTSSTQIALFLAPRSGRSRGVRLTQAPLRSVAPREGGTVVLEATLPAATAPASYRLLACIARGGVVPPRDECLEVRTPLKVTAAPPPPRTPAPVAPAPTGTPAPGDAAPVARPDETTTVLGQARTVAAPGVLSNDTDAEGRALTAHVVAPPSHGTLTLRPDGGYTYVPAAGFAGTDSFTYSASDGTQTSAPAKVTVEIRGADLAATISASDTTPDVGDTITLTVTASNAGPVRVDDAVVSVPLPSGLTFVAGPGAYVAGTGVWTVGTILPGASVQANLQATVTAGAVPSAVVYAEIAGGPGDPDATDDLASVALTVGP